MRGPQPNQIPRERGSRSPDPWQAVEAPEPEEPAILQPFDIDGLTFYPELHRMRRGEETRNLEPKVFGVLVALARRPGDVVTRDQIFDEVWPETAVEEGVLFRAISELRRLFDDDPRTPRVIETIRSRGYRLITQVRFPERPEPDLAPAPGEADQAHAIHLHSQLDNKTPSATEPPPRVVLEPVRESPPQDETPSRHRGLIAGGVGLLLTLAAVFFTVGVRFDRAAEDSTPQLEPPPTPRTFLPGAEIDPSLSPDGSGLVYSWVDVGSERREIQIWMPGDSEPRVLASSPGPTALPAWSPQGDSVVFWRVSGTTQNLVQLPVVGGSERIVLSNRAQVGAFAWAPDGRSVWTSFAGEEGVAIHRVDLEQGLLTQVSHPTVGSSHDSNVAVDSTGETLAFVRRRSGSWGDIWTVPAEGGTETKVFEGAAIHGLAWVPDRPMLLFSGYLEGRSGLWLVNLDGRTPRWMEVPDASWPSFSADGSTLAFSRSSYRANLWSAPLQGGSPTILIESSRKARHPALDPSGSRLAFSSDRDGHYSIWTVDADGSNPRKVASGQDYASRPAWSPDGRRLAFEANSEDAQLDVFVVDVPTEPTPRRLTTHAELDRDPAWSVDGQFVFFASTRSGRWQIWRVAAAGGRPEPVEGAHGRSPAATGDGRHLVFANLAARTLAYVPIEGGESTSILSLDDLQAWTLDPAGRVVYLLWNDSTLRRMDLSSGLEEEIRELGRTAPGPFDLAVSEDRIVFSQVVTLEADVFSLPTSELLRRLER